MYRIGEKGDDNMELEKKYTIVAILAVLGLTTAILIPGSSSPSTAEYDPWADMNDDGQIDIYDVAYVASEFGTTGTPINKTALLLARAADYIYWSNPSIPYDIWQLATKTGVVKHSEGDLNELISGLSGHHYFLSGGYKYRTKATATHYMNFEGAGWDAVAFVPHPDVTTLDAFLEWTDTETALAYCSFRNFRLAGSGKVEVGIKFTGQNKDTKMLNMYVEGFVQEGLIINGGWAFTLSWSAIEGCGDSGLRMEKIGTAVTKDANICQNKIGANGSPNLDIRIDRVRIHHNNMWGDAIFVDGEQVIIDHNTIPYHSAHTDHYYIKVGPNAKDVHIDHNILAQYGACPEYAVKVETGAENTKIVDNDMSGYWANPILDSGVGTQIQDNEGNVGSFQTTTSWDGFNPSGVASEGTRVLVNNITDDTCRLYAYSNGRWRYVELT